MALLKAFCPSHFLEAMMDAYNGMVMGLAVQLPWVPLVAEVEAADGMRDVHELGASHGLE
jgi:hypothetical protein